MGYYKLTFNNCSAIEYAFTVVPFSDIEEYINKAAINREPKRSGACIVISYVDWTDEQYEKWFEANILPNA